MYVVRKGKRCLPVSSRQYRLGTHGVHVHACHYAKGCFVFWQKGGGDFAVCCVLGVPSRGGRRHSCGWLYGDLRSCSSP